MIENRPDNTVMVNSNAVRLSSRQWLVAALIVLAVVVAAPFTWRHIERFSPGPDYRIPYELSSDYWLYRRYSDWTATENKIAVIGDSVIWGHYVAPDGTLSHFLNRRTDNECFTNLGLDGTHPLALEGLIAHYADSLAGQRVVLQFNPLWLTSAKHDLQTPKEFNFNHPKLVPQFAPKIPCYRASFSTRLWAVIERFVPFFSWTSHLKVAYLGGADLPHWTLEHPYENPLTPLAQGLPKPKTSTPQLEGERPKSAHVAWVTLESSLQWRSFRHTIERLQQRRCHVFVLVGPLNEHMLSDRDLNTYRQIEHGIETWLQANDVPYLMPETLPASLYADLSHPLADGYARLATQLADTPAFTATLPPSASLDVDSSPAR